MIEEVQKTQLARLSSIVLFPPLMIYFATRDKLSNNQRILIGLIGVGTFVTVFYAWNENRKALNDVEG